MPSITYPLDLTGNAVTNYIVGETHTINALTRAFVPVGGPYYTTGVTLRRASDNSVLFPVVHYKLLHYVRAASKDSGKEVCSVIYVHDPAINGDVILDYHVVGGEFTTSVSTIQDILDSIDLNDKPVYWGEILDKPNDFPPTEHLQHTDTIFGMNTLVAALERVKQAIQQGDQAQFQAVYDYINTAISNMSVDDGAIDTLRTELNAALGNHVSNPSAHTPAQVGLGSVMNWVPGTAQDHTSGTANRYATTAGVKGLIDIINNALGIKANSADIKITGSGLAAVQKTVDSGTRAEFTATVAKASAQDLADATSTTKAVTPDVLKPFMDTSIDGKVNAAVLDAFRNLHHGRILTYINKVTTTDVFVDIVAPGASDALLNYLKNTPGWYLKIHASGGGGGGGSVTTAAANSVAMGARGGNGARGWAILVPPADFDETSKIQFKLGAGGMPGSSYGAGLPGGITEVQIVSPTATHFARWGGGGGGGVYRSTAVTSRFSVNTGLDGIFTGTAGFTDLQASQVPSERSVFYDGVGLLRSSHRESKYTPVGVETLTNTSGVLGVTGFGMSANLDYAGAGGGGSFCINTTIGSIYLGGMGTLGRLYMEIILGVPNEGYKPNLFST